MRKNPKQIAFARQLRRKQTDAEKVLWARLRREQLGGSKFRRQQLIGPYIVDFVSFASKLILEIDGGHHNEKKVMMKDEEREAFLEDRGYRVLRFWNNGVLVNLEGVLETIRQALQPPHPDPLPQGERGSGMVFENSSIKKKS